MTDYEYTFITTELTEDITGTLYERFDCLVGTNHSGQTYVTMTTEGPDALTAGKTAHMKLIELGIKVKRAEYDLVSRPEIARRLDKTPQAVGNWIRGNRPTRTSFPDVFNEVGGGVWLWSDVVEWAREAIEIDTDPGMNFPTREAIEELNVCIYKAYVPVPAAHSFSLPMMISNTDFNRHSMVVVELSQEYAGKSFRLSKVLLQEALNDKVEQVDA